MRMRAGLCLIVAASLVASCDDPAAVAPPTGQTTADCTAPTYATDMLVCDDPDLRALDADLARLWAQVEADPNGDPAAAEAQAAWFRERSLCAFEADHRGCAEATYRDRRAACAIAATAKRCLHCSATSQIG
jgi:uncharacterized protein